MKIRQIAEKQIYEKDECMTCQWRYDSGGCAYSSEGHCNYIPKFKIGDIVDYHSVIGGPVTSTAHSITNIQQLPNGTWVAWLSDKAGCVAIEAISLGRTDKKVE